MEIEAMKIENQTRHKQHLSPAYNEEAFMEKARELDFLAYCCDEEL